MARILAARRHAEVVEGHRVEVVIGERDKPEATAAQLHNFVEHTVHVPLPRTLAVGTPDGTEGTVLRTSAHRLYRRPHVPPLGQQLPPAWHELVGLDTT